MPTEEALKDARAIVVQAEPVVETPPKEPVGLGALGAGYTPPVGLPANIQADLVNLVGTAGWLNSVNTDAANLLADATTLQSLTGSATAEVLDIQKAHATIFTSNGATPAQTATILSNIVTDLTTQAQTVVTQAATISSQGALITQAGAHATALQGQIANLQAQVATLQTQLAARTGMVTTTPGSGAAVPAPPVTPANSGMTTFLIGTAVVLGIGGTAWYLSKNRPGRSPMPSSQHMSRRLVR
jgi:hypothetical protein